MKKLTIITFLFLIGFSSFAQKADLIHDCQELILNTFRYGDLNPIHQPETDSINQNFKNALLNRDFSNLNSDYNSDIELIFKLIYDNSTNEYEDSPDYRRLKMRRSICFATIALKSSFDKAYTFLEYSKVSLIETIEQPDTELIENQYLGLMILEISFKIEENQLNKKDVDKLNKYLTENKDLIAKQNYVDSQRLIENCRLTIK